MNYDAIEVNSGDINGDGIADLLIGAPYLLSQAGQSYVVFGGKNVTSEFPTIVTTGTTGTTGFRIPVQVQLVQPEQLVPQELLEQQRLELRIRQVDGHNRNNGNNWCHRNYSDHRQHNQFG